MSLDTYANLKLEIAAYIDRNDTSVTSGGVDTFIDLTEAWFNRNLRVRQMTDSTSALSVTAGVITHPTGWLEWRQVVMTTIPIVELDITSEKAALAIDSSNAAGTPSKVIVRGTSSIIWPLPDSTSSYTYRGIWYTAVPALTGSNTTNWLLTAYPDAYLYGALMHSSVRLQDDPRVPIWREAFSQVVDEIKTAEANSQVGQAMTGPVIRNVV